MKILFQSRSDLLSHSGGDTTQVLKTKSFLEKMGYDVDIDLSVNSDVSKYDIIHIFNLQTLDYTKEQVRNSKKQGKKVVLSTIWWDFKYIHMDQDFRTFSRSTKYRVCNNLFNLFCVFFEKEKRNFWFDKIIFSTTKKNKGQDILNLVDWILPNSNAELEILVQDFAMPQLRSKASVVVNAIDNNNFNKLVNFCDERINMVNDYVLCVGRIEPIKGQAKIIKALMENVEIPLVFIGRGIESAYGKKCLELANKRGNTFFLSEVAHENLKFYYQKAKVHVLPSLRESPGLVSLEAAIFDTNIVTSYYTPVYEYFGLDAWICDPNSIFSIKNKILEAYNSPINFNLKKRILQDFTWDKAAKQTSDIYMKLMNKE